MTLNIFIVLFWILTSLVENEAWAQSRCEEEFANVIRAVDSQNSPQARQHLDAMVENMGQGRYKLVAMPLFLAWPKVSFMPKAEDFKDAYKKVLQSIETYMVFDLAANNSKEAKRYLNEVNFLRTLPSTSVALIISEKLALLRYEIFKRPISDFLFEYTSTVSPQDLRDNIVAPADLGQSLKIRYYLRQIQLLYTVEFSTSEAKDSVSLALHELEQEHRSILGEADGIHTMDEQEWKQVEELFHAIHSGDENLVRSLLQRNSRFTIDSPYLLDPSPSENLHLWTAMQFAIFNRQAEIAQLISNFRLHPLIAY